MRHKNNTDSETKFSDSMLSTANIAAKSESLISKIIFHAILTQTFLLLAANTS